MFIKLTKESLECYILICLNIQEMHRGQLFNNVCKHVNITPAKFYSALLILERDGKITRRYEISNGAAYDVYSITPTGQKDLNRFLKK